MANPNPKNQMQKGETRNPNGRPKRGETLTDILNMKSQVIDPAQKLPIRELIAEKLLKLAMDGDIAALKYVYDRIDGTPRQSIDLDAKMEGSLTQDFFKIVIVDPKEPESDEITTPSNSTD